MYCHRAGSSADAIHSLPSKFAAFVFDLSKLPSLVPQPGLYRTSPKPKSLGPLFSLEGRIAVSQNGKYKRRTRAVTLPVARQIGKGHV